MRYGESGANGNAMSAPQNSSGSPVGVVPSDRDGANAMSTFLDIGPGTYDIVYSHENGDAVL